MQRLVKHLYDQASESVSKTVVAKITTRGIETPLGILSRKQIQRGEDVLAQLNDLLAAEGADVDDDVPSNPLPPHQSRFFLGVCH